MKRTVFLCVCLMFVFCLTDSRTEASPKGSMMHDKMMSKNVGEVARAELEGTQPGSGITGTVIFTQTNEGVEVEATLNDVSQPGKHGIHIHEFGSCANAGAAAGGHYNPKGTDHGFYPKDGMKDSHVGDMGNIEIDEDGSGTLSLILPHVSVTGGYKSIAGRAVILHEKEDDFGQPTGNAGGRIACGTIAVTESGK